MSLISSLESLMKPNQLDPIGLLIDKLDNLNELTPISLTTKQLLRALGYAEILDDVRSVDVGYNYANQTMFINLVQADDVLAEIQITDNGSGGKRYSVDGTLILDEPDIYTDRLMALTGGLAIHTELGHLILALIRASYLNETHPLGVMIHFVDPNNVPDYVRDDVEPSVPDFEDTDEYDVIDDDVDDVELEDEVEEPPTPEQALNKLEEEHGELSPALGIQEETEAKADDVLAEVRQRLAAAEEKVKAIIEETKEVKSTPELIAELDEQVSEILHLTEPEQPVSEEEAQEQITKDLANLLSADDTDFDELADKIIASADPETVERLKDQPINGELLAQALGATEVEEKPEEPKIDMSPEAIAERRRQQLIDVATHIDKLLDPCIDREALKALPYNYLVFDPTRSDIFTTTDEEGNYIYRSFQEKLAHVYCQRPIEYPYDPQRHVGALTRLIDDVLPNLYAVRFDPSVLAGKFTIEELLHQPKWALDKDFQQLIIGHFRFDKVKDRYKLPDIFADELHRLLASNRKNIRDELQQLYMFDIVNKPGVHAYATEDYEIAAVRFNRTDAEGNITPTVILIHVYADGVTYTPVTFTQTGLIDRCNHLTYLSQLNTRAICSVGSAVYTQYSDLLEVPAQA